MNDVCLSEKGKLSKNFLQTIHDAVESTVWLVKTDMDGILYFFSASHFLDTARTRGG